MSALLGPAPYGTRDDGALLHELEALTQHHLQACDAYARIHAGWVPSGEWEQLPFIHTQVFKHVLLRSDGAQHERVLRSSATTGALASQITLDARSSQLQARSSHAILADFIGGTSRPLLVLDSAASLRSRDVPARVAAAMSLKPFASEIVFALDHDNDMRSLNAARVLEALHPADEVLLYGITSRLWQLAQAIESQADLKRVFAKHRVRFVHSGGWKKLEAERVDRTTFNERLLACAAVGSSVLDYYGLVEQNGVPMPACDDGARHLPRWANVLARDPVTGEVVVDGAVGALQLMNPLAWGAPYHSVLTEDLGRVLPDGCKCGRQGRRFELIGRIPRAEARGCANV